MSALRAAVASLALGAVPSSVVTLRAQPPRPALAVLGAMSVEVELLRARLVHPVSRTIGGVEFVQGTLAGRPVVIAHVGVGKVNAAMTTTLLIEHFHPRRVLFTGVAGALDSALSVGDVVLGSYSAQHDLGVWDARGVTNATSGASAITSNPVRFPGDTLLLRLARTAAGARADWHVREGGVLTGDVFLSNDSVRRDLRRRFPDALAVEMEGAAVAQVCWQQGRVPLLVVRSISDGAGANAQESFEQFVRRAAERSSDLVARVVAAVPAR
jgi:adenosylhomocysteine nucleosidase